MFWPTVERGYFALWPEEPNLGLPIADRSIEDSGLTDAEQKLLGDAETKTTGKQKRLANAPASSSAASTAMEQLVSALLGGTGGKRKKHAWEIWQKRNGSLIKAALAETDFASLMPPPIPSETKKQAADRVAEGARQQMIVRHRVEKELFEEASDGEMDEVHKIYALQTVEKAVPTKSETPEEFQKGLDNLDPLMKTFHGLGQRPDHDAEVYSYCHGTTPSGHSMAESVSSWNEGFLVPLQQFGKKVFDHQTRCARALGASQDTGEGSSGAESLQDPSAAGEYPTSLDGALYTIPPAPMEEHHQDDLDDLPLLPNAPQSNPGCSTGDIAIDPVLLEISSPDNVAIDPFLIQDQCSPLHAEQHSGLLNANVPPLPETTFPCPEAEFDLRPLSADSPSHHGPTSTLVNFPPFTKTRVERSWRRHIAYDTYSVTFTCAGFSAAGCDLAVSADTCAGFSAASCDLALAGNTCAGFSAASCDLAVSADTCTGFGAPICALAVAGDRSAGAVSAGVRPHFDPGICPLAVAGNHNAFSLNTR
ncbi:hypothetical protein B0H14DRAFT_3493800 [Mycena olivaceomarginata]|nr:hypothetical protein B0H14DRAFT_3493800 [Mycena olivaceomarginata]